LQRTTAKAVSRLYPVVLAKYPTVSDLARANRRELESLLAPIGIYRVRSRRLVDLARRVDTEWSGKLPTSARGLESLPGVGLYIASAIRSQAHGIRTPMVDSNVERVWRRVFKRHLRRIGARPPSSPAGFCLAATTASSTSRSSTSARRYAALVCRGATSVLWPPSVTTL